MNAIYLGNSGLSQIYTMYTHPFSITSWAFPIPRDLHLHRQYTCTDTKRDTDM